MYFDRPAGELLGQLHNYRGLVVAEAHGGGLCRFDHTSFM